MKPGFFQGKKFPFTPKRRNETLGSQCNNIIDTRHDLAAFRSKLANVSWLRSYTQASTMVCIQDLSSVRVRLVQKHSRKKCTERLAPV